MCFSGRSQGARKNVTVSMDLCKCCDSALEWGLVADSRYKALLTRLDCALTRQRKGVRP